MIKGMIMRLHVVSDLHIEFSNYELQVQEADVLVLPGDIGVGLTGLDYAGKYKKHYRHVLYVPGNHEFYGHHLSKLSLEMKKMAQMNGVTLLDNDIINIDGVNFIGSTLWTDFRLYGEELHLIGYYMNRAANGLNDFNQIRYGTYWFQPSNCATLSVSSQEFIRKHLEETEGSTNVVVTHHCPSKKSIHPKYEGSSLNPCFANDLDYLVSQADLWIHGHTHDSMDYILGDCRVVCNPRGYSKYQDKQENVNFIPDFVIEI